MIPFKDKQAYKDNFIGEHGYFNLEGYVKYCLDGSGLNTDWKMLSGEPLLFIFAAERNMGKSYGTWEYIHKEIWEKHNYEWKIIYMRSNEEKIKAYAKHFNADWYEEKKLYYMTDKAIFKCYFDDLGNELVNQRKTIGFCTGVKNADKYRSGSFKDVHFVFWDEYNEHDEGKETLQLFQKYVELTKTVERMGDPFMMVLVGNKVNSNNQIIVKLEIEPMFDDLGEDYIEELAPGKYYIDISKTTFDHLQQTDRLANWLASFDRDLNRYMNEGGHLKIKDRDVLIWRTRIAPTAKPQCYIQLGENVIEYGDFINPFTNEESVYFHLVYEDEIDEQYKIIAGDKIANISSKNARKMHSKKQYERFTQSIARAMKNGAVFYDDPDVKQLVKVFVLSYLK